MKQRKNVIATSILYSLFIILYSAPVAFAFESSSGSFEIHAGAIESTTGTSSSASFKNTNSAGESVPGTSIGASKEVFSSVIHWLYGFFIAQYTQSHFRWRNDDGSETTATWPKFEDTEYNSFPKNTATRLRLEVSNDGWTRGSPPSFTLEFAELSSGSDCTAGPFTTTYLAVPTDYTKAMHLSTTTQSITDGAATTNQLTASNATFTAGQMKFLGNTTGAITLDSDKFTEVEYGVSATSLATNGARYCFRVTNSGSTVNMVYTLPEYATAVVASGLSATGVLDSAVFDAVTPTGALQGPAYNSIMWKGSQNGSSGKVQFQFATSDSSSGPWNFYGSQTGTCNTSNYYDTTGTDVPVELSCSPTYHNNQRYFRYRIRICSLDCNASGSASPIVNDVIVNWAP